MPDLVKPIPGWRPHRRLLGSFTPSTAFLNADVVWQLIPIAGALSLRIRIKTATGGGTLDGVFVGPDFLRDQAAATAYASLVGTKYTSGNATQLAVTAGTEAKMDVTCSGEDYLLLKWTAGADGTFTYVDVAQLSYFAR